MSFPGLSVPLRVMLGSFPAREADGLHRLIRAARSGDSRAVADLLDRVSRAAPAVWPGVTDALAVPVPGHLPGATHPLVLAVARAVARARDWDYAEDALRRARPAPEAKAAGARDLTAEVATLEWVPWPLGRVVVLIDDVVRSGTTLRSCADAMRAAGETRNLLAIAAAEALEDREAGVPRVP